MKCRKIYICVVKAYSCYVNFQMIRMFFVQFLDVFPIFYIFPSIFVS